jgi:hypothetical protein
MSTNFSLNNVLRKIPNCLLEEYLSKKNIEPIVTIEARDAKGDRSQRQVRISELPENHFQPIKQLIAAQDYQIQTLIENDFRKISERACKAGFLCLLDESKYEGHGIDIQDELEAMENHYERAMWVFLKHPIIFANAGYFQRIDKITFKSRPVWKGISPKQFDGDLEGFKNKMIEHYKKEGRGNHCKIEVLKRPDPERYYYFVYLEDYSDTLDEFKGSEFKRTPIKPAFEVIFAYHPGSGKIEHNAGGKSEGIKQLHEAFCQGVLGMEKLPDKDSTMYDLEKLKTRFNFMPRDPQDNIAAVHLKMIELEISGKKKIIFTDSNKTPNIYDMIETALNQDNVPLDIVTVSKAKIQIIFKKMANERRARMVTFEISTPDSCSLKDSPTDLIARRYVEDVWKFVDEQRIESPEEAELLSLPV